MLNKKVASEIAVGIIVLLVVVIGGIFWMQGRKVETVDPPIGINKQKPVINEPDEKKGVICTQDAKLCLDGSYVSRTGPNCEFAACPGKSESANWQTYKNEKYGFSLKYPNDWKISLSEMDGFAKNYFMPPSHFECVKQKESGKLDEFAPCGSVLFGVASNPEKLKFEDYYKKEFGEEFYRDLKTISVNGETAYSLIASSAYDGSESVMFWIPLPDGNFFEIGGSYIDKEETIKMEKIFNSFVY